MRKRKINRNKPMFKRKRTPAKTALNVFLVILMLLVIVFLGYSVGKGFVEFLNNRPDKPVDSEKLPDHTDPVETDEPVVTEPTSVSEESVVTTPPEPVKPEKKQLLFVTMPEGGDYDDYLNKQITYAEENGYSAIVLELLSEGGNVYYATADVRANAAGAVAAGGIADLTSACKRISDSGLKPVARISLLTDHFVSWYDKSACYLFENSTSTWLDDSVANGGKAWLSPFASGAREYMASIITEISNAGFAGIIAGEIAFPRFRNSDLNYIGQSVKSSDRYTALVDFSNAAQDALGAAKEYGIEVRAEDILSDKAEILKGLSLLNAQTVYIRYDSAAIGTRIEKADGSEVSYVGLSETEKLNVVMKSIQSAFNDSGKTIVPAVGDKSLIPTLVSLGFDEASILLY